MAHTRKAPVNLLIAFALGAGAGFIAWLDQILIGGVDYAASIQTLPPLRGFLWNVVGAGALAVVLYLACLGLIGLDRRLDRSDPVHASHCMWHWPRYRRSHRCTCDADARNWSPEKRRAALRTLRGGLDARNSREL